MSASDPQPQPPPSPEPAPPRRWLRLLGGFLAVVVIFLAIAPSIVAWTPLRNILARHALSGLAGQITIGGASLGWFSVIELHDVTVTDPEGNTVASLPHIASDRTLLSLTRDRSDLGTFTLARPALQVVAEERTTNLERVFAGFLQPGKPASARTVVALKVVDATVTLRDVPAERTTTLTPVALEVTLPATGDPTVTLAATLRDANPSKIAAEMAADRTTLTVENFPLEALAPALRRLDPATTIAGRLTGEVALDRTGETGRPTLRLVGKLRGSDLVVTSPALRGDTLRLNRVEMPVDLAVTEESLLVRRAEVRCDVGTVLLRGSFDAEEPVESLLVRPGLSVDAEVDLARVARLLPRLLGVRDGTTLHEGKITAKLASRAGDGDTVWKGEVRTSAIRAERAGQKLDWDDPLGVSFTSRVKAGELPTFDAFECRSEFLSATAQGSANACQLRAVLSLDRLAARLANLVDLGGVTLAGGALLKLDATRTPANEVHLVGSVSLDRFAYADRTGRAVREPQVQAAFDVKGSVGTGKPIRVASAAVGVNLGGDTLEASLRESLPDLLQITALQANVKLTGDLARWRARVGKVVALPPDLLVAGTGSIFGVASLSGATTTFNADAEVRNLVYGPPTAPVWKDPLIKVSLAGAVEPAREHLRLDRLTLAREALSCEARGTVSRWTTARTVALQGALTCDLDRLSPQLREFLGADFIATGQARRDFHLTGDLNSFATLKAGAALAWTGARTHGFEVGPGELRLALAGGTVTASPLEANFSGGRVRAQPSIHLDPAPQEAMLAPGVLVDRAKLTTQATNGAVGYALPAIANSTRAEGELSFVLEGNRIPLANPRGATIRGKMVVHRATVTAGPVVSEIVQVLRLGTPTVTLASENVVPVRLEAGRVYHENLTLNIGGHVVRTSGSVGLDGSLMLVVELPLPPSLFPANPRVSQALANKTIPVAIGGTLTQPRLDSRAFQEGVARLAGTVVQDTIRETGREILDKQLNKLLPGLPGLPRR